MGRPLNKKYFGNRNIGTNGTSDNKIGGEGIASVTLNALGSYTTRPTVTFPLPQLPTGVRATGTITSEALSATVAGGSGGSNYTVGDLLTITTAGGSATAYVASVDAGNSNAILTVNFTGTGGSRGSFTSLGSTTTANGTVANPLASGASLVLTWRAKQVVVTEKGSGYTAAPAGGSLTFTQSVTATSTALTTSSGAPGSSTNQENAIISYAWIPTADGGTQRLVADIIKQVSTRRYKVRTSEGVGICKLVTDGSSGAGKMDITAYDAAGSNNEYWVTKLCSRDVTLVSKGGGLGGSQFTNGRKVKWTFGSAVAPSGSDIGTAKIENA